MRQKSKVNLKKKEQLISIFIVTCALVGIIFSGRANFLVGVAFGYGGGGGAGGGASGAPIPTPPGGFSVVIDDDATSTESQTVTLTLNGGDYADKMRIANFSDFRDASYETYQTTKEWTLTEGDGTKTVYAKFYSVWNAASEIVSDTIILGTPPPPAPEIELTPEAQKADANQDGAITVLDFNVLMVNWGTGGGGGRADFNEDGMVDVFDFNLLMVHWTT